MSRKTRSYDRVFEINHLTHHKMTLHPRPPVSCKASEMKDIFASEESLKAALTEFPNVLYDESEYMTNDEMIEDFMWRYKRYMASIDDNIKTMGTCLGDYGIKY